MLRECVLGRGLSGTWLAGWVTSAVLAWVSTAAAQAPAAQAPAAQAPGQAFRLEYWAEGRCPDAIEFARQIQTRAPRLRPAVADEPALGFYAELVDRSGSATGRLTARTADGREVTREVRGTTCDDVVTALALIAALAADPNQTAEAAPSAPAHSRPPHVRRARHRDDDELPPEPPPLPPRWSFGVGGGLSFDSSIAPSPGYGIGVEFDAEGPEGSPWRALFGLSAIRAAAASTQTRAGNASFTYLAFRGTACPLRWPEDTPLFMRPCLALDAGLLEGDVSLSPYREDRSKSWFAVDAFARVEALVDEVVSLQLDGGVTAPLKRDSFDAGAGSEQAVGAQSAFRAPATGVLGRIGLSYRFR
ncbi:MAG: hypothetical protein ABI488_24470 [Polyangiaceae bacterium]